MINDLVLARLDTARTALAEAKTIQETKTILDVAVAAETYAKRQQLGDEAILYATSIKIEALRQLGEMLEGTPRNKGSRLVGGSEILSGGSKVEPPDETPTLAELGLDKKTSKLAQDVFALSDSEIEKLKTGVMTLSDAKRETRKQERFENLVTINSNNKPLNGDIGKFNVIYADPPWRYEHPISDSRRIENQYPTMSLDEICNLPIHEIREDNAILFLWASTPMLKQALLVMGIWGFEYRTGLVWVKPSIGPGQWVRQRHEHLLIGIRGNIPTPYGGNKPDSVVEAPRERHSQKPDVFYSIIEQMYPSLSKVELFSRNPREGWAAWGNQV